MIFTQIIQLEMIYVFQGLNPLKFNFEGSNGVPLKGDPSAFHACFKA